MVKIVDVAREAGVAPSTVSRVLNNHPSVGAEYIDRVRSAASKLGYRPNGVARNLRRQATDLVALVIPDVGNHFCTAVTRGVEDAAREAGLSVLLYNSDEDSAKQAAYLDVAASEKVAGVVLSPFGADTDIELLREGRIPLVGVDRPIAADIDSVTTDSRAGAREATAHLLGEGWTSPGLIGGPLHAATAQWRLEGYTEALRAAGRDPRVAHASFDIAGGAEAAAALLDAPDAPDALLVSNEQMALGVLAELRTRSLVPGRDIGLVTFDDTPWAPLMDPPLSVVAQPAYEMGARSMRLLIDRIRREAGPEPRHVVLPTRLIVRESSTRR